MQHVYLQDWIRGQRMRSRKQQACKVVKRLGISWAIGNNCNNDHGPGTCPILTNEVPCVFDQSIQVKHTIAIFPVNTVIREVRNKSAIGLKIAEAQDF